MCEDCKSPLAWDIDMRGMLIVPVADITANTPKVEGWEPFGVDVNFYDPRETGIAKTFTFRQTTPTFFIVPYIVTENWGGPEEGGWHYYREERDGEPVTIVKGERIHAEAICRSLNRLANQKHVEEWGRYHDFPRRSFGIDRWIGENDNSNDPRPHYC